MATGRLGRHVSADLTQKVSANLQLSYDDVKTFGAAGNLVFHVVPGFDVTTEVDYQKLENPVGGGATRTTGAARFASSARSDPGHTGYCFGSARRETAGPSAF